MGKKEKLLEKARNSDFETLMSRLDWVMDHQSGSHQIWYSPKGYRISVQNRLGKAKGYQVKQFLNQYDEENDNE